MALLSKTVEDRIYSSIPADSLALITCQRIEVITTRPLDEMLLVDALGLAPLQFEGMNSALSRLAEIACGLRSQVLGERSIFKQLQQAAIRAAADSPVYRLAMRALAVAAETRLRHNFYATNDYEETVLQLLAHDGELLNGKRPTTFVAVGGGMLGSAVATAASQHQFERIVLLTRSVRKTRKDRGKTVIVDLSERVDAGPIPIEVTSLSRFPYEKLSRGYCTFIATSGITETYKREMLDLISHPHNVGTVDFCSVPTFDGGARIPDYVTMYDDLYLRQVSINNERLAPVVAGVKAHLEAVVQTECMQVVHR
jgi:glutamyl-tRNA reductase